jgi:hypothetical protein
VDKLLAALVVVVVTLKDEITAYSPQVHQVGPDFAHLRTVVMHTLCMPTATRMPAILAPSILDASQLY